MQAAFSQIAASLGGPSAGRGLGAGPSTAPAAPVVDLGVVGRGTKRVTPMPFPAASTSGQETVSVLMHMFISNLQHS